MMSKTSLPQLGSDGRILEAIVTTSNKDGTINIAPMGPLVDDGLERLVLRPFRTSTTYKNLIRTSQGVLHITDDVLLFAKAAIGTIKPIPEFLESDPMVLAAACRWLKFEIVSVDDSAERSIVVGHTTKRGHIREFFGFNRAKHAVLEAAILATRIHILDAKLLLSELDRLASPIQKTGGADELQAFALLQSFVHQELAVPFESEILPR
ncbi:DUF447 domain-containing protein [Bythopirellula goksoeyrii]|uniref:DUF447 family protein n=1 Tax=Bythopirellula goksoeyrii TaxID=1400387 RepID=A0A5B9Q928_9BACT|nr:DUF447 domain-containing protein [Bythopirellula goksoeyrii]QEG35507.1 hypothetical protein Pr1d_28080 [Bythopirellula goksoeyrii]